LKTTLTVVGTLVLADDGEETAITEAKPIKLNIKYCDFFIIKTPLQST